MVAILKKRRILVPAAVVLVALITIGLFVFAPWKLFTSSTVNEALVPAQASPSVARPDAATLLRQGQFRTLEHPTTGQAELVKLADGSHILQLRDFSTSDGPAVHVWLSDKPRNASDAEFGKDGHLDLGLIKATNGNQVYQIPAGYDVSKFQSVLIWCQRFSVGFGVAGLQF